MTAKVFEVETDEGKSVVDAVWSELEREGLSLPGSDAKPWRHEAVRSELLRQVRKLARRRAKSKR